MPAWPVEVVPLNPVSCASALWRMEGFMRVTIVVKATFGIVPEGPARLIAPDPVVAYDRHLADHPGTSVEVASEIAPYVPRAGVVLTGHAYAPGGVHAPAVSAHLAIARERPLIDKTVHVFGDRSPANPHAPAPFQRMPLRWERAFGGPGVDANPVGTGAVAGSALPNLVDPQDPRRPACFGPIAATWPARLGLLDPLARSRLDERVQDLGAGFPFGYFQPAPLDQRLDAIEGDEWIVLDGLHPALARVRSRLPSARGTARAAIGSGPLQPVDLTGDLLVIDADRQVCSVIWRGHLVVGHDASALAALRVYAGVEIAGRALEWPVVAYVAPPEPEPEPEPELSEISEGGETTMLSLAELQAQAAKAAMPFPLAGAVAPAPAPRAPRDVPSIGTPWSGAPAPAPPPPIIDDETTVGIESVPAPMTAPPITAPPITAPPVTTAPVTAAPALPFTTAPAGLPFTPPIAADPPPPPRAPREPEPEGTSVLSLADLMKQAGRAIAPFAVASPGAPSAPRAATLAGTPWAANDASTGAIDADASPDAPAQQLAEGPPKRGDRPAVPIVNPTPLVAVTIPWQVRPPKDSLTIIVKGTFDLVAHGPAAIRAEGELPTGDLHLDDDPEKSLAYASDFAYFKPKADVTLTGSAYAPPTAGGATPAMQVAFHFGVGHDGGRPPMPPGAAASRGFVRRAAVLGDRRWQGTLLALAPTDPAPFAKMPITWERAFGGAAFDGNPVGAGHKGQPGADGIPRLPNVEDPAHLVRGPGDAPAPVCFAPIPTLWKERWSKLGTYDRRWFKTRWPYFPEDFDWAFSQAAPAAQQLPYLTGDESFSIIGMRPDTPRLDGQLPGIRARVFLQMTEEAGSEFREIPLVLDTAAFDADALKLSLVWRAFVEVSDDEAPEIEAIFVMREDLAATPVTLAEARAAYIAAATPPPPEEADPHAAPVVLDDGAEPPKDDVEETRRAVLKQLEAAGVPVAEIDPTPAAPPPPQDPDVVAEALRAGGATDEEVAEVLAAITPPPDEDDAAPPGDLRARVVAMLAAGDKFDGLDLAGADLADLDFAGRSLVATVLKGASLARCSFAGAVLEGAVLSRADLSESVLQSARLALADLAGAKAPKADFTGARLDETDLTGADLTGAVFDRAQGESTQLARARLAGATFREADLRDADFTAATLDDAVFDKAQLPEVRLYDVTAHGASFRGAMMKGARVEGARAVRAIFANIDAKASIWERAHLDDASFHGAVLAGASFARASCPRAVFSTADLTEARFRRAKLSAAAFLRANLMMATFERADLTRADLRGANLHAAETWKAKLDQAKLDQAIVTGSKLA